MKLDEMVSMLKSYGFFEEYNNNFSLINKVYHLSMLNANRDIQLKIFYKNTDEKEVVSIKVDLGAFYEDLSLTRFGWKMPPDKFFETIDEELREKLLYHLDLFE